jgi:hypothetical protein
MDDTVDNTVVPLPLANASTTSLLNPKLFEPSSIPSVAAGGLPQTSLFVYLHGPITTDLCTLEAKKKKKELESFKRW